MENLMRNDPQNYVNLANRRNDEEETYRWTQLLDTMNRLKDGYSTMTGEDFYKELLKLTTAFQNAFNTRREREREWEERQARLERFKALHTAIVARRTSMMMNRRNRSGLSISKKQVRQMRSSKNERPPKSP